MLSFSLSLQCLVDVVLDVVCAVVVVVPYWSKTERGKRNDPCCWLVHSLIFFSSEINVFSEILNSFHTWLGIKGYHGLMHVKYMLVHDFIKNGQLAAN